MQGQTRAAIAMVETFRNLVSMVQQSDDEPDRDWSLSSTRSQRSRREQRRSRTDCSGRPHERSLAGLALRHSRIRGSGRAADARQRGAGRLPPAAICESSLGDPDARPRRTPELPRLRDLALDPAVGPRRKVQLALALHPAAGSILSHALWGGQHPDTVGRFYLRQSPHSATGTGRGHRSEKQYDHTLLCRRDRRKRGLPSTQQQRRSRRSSRKQLRLQK